jgi:phage terminase large subunit-like protein
MESGEIQLPVILLKHIIAEQKRRRRNIFYSLFPDEGEFRRELYAKHIEFFKNGKDNRVRLFRAANRAGKTIAGAYECVCHLTGLYPHWWVGRRFKHPVNVLVAGESGKLTRDSLQKKLMGEPSEIGTGIVPKDCILDIRAKSGIPDAMDTVRIKHIYGTSTLQFNSFDQGREAFQATERDVVWFDEEPPLSVYTEGLTRTMTTGGIVMLTFTPLKGMSETVMFLDKQCRDGNASVTTATWDDAPHLTENDKAEMMKAYPPHQRDARMRGIPSLGSGAIYPVPESEFTVEPFPISKHWKHVYGMDVGWNNTAAVFAATDPESGIVYITSDYKRGQAEPSIHASAITARARGTGKPGVIDPASKGRSQHDGEQIISIYRQLGLNLTEADNGVEAGLYACWEMFSTGRLKVFRSCLALLEEYRIYRRDEKGRVVKDNDHIMDALRYLVVSGLPLAKQEMEVKKTNAFAVTGGGQNSWMGK